MEQRILRLFLYKDKLKFNEIEKDLKIRSNKLVYHLKKLIQKGIIEKAGEDYLLSEVSENLIPYLSEKKSSLVTVLIHLGEKEKCFLYKRNKRPYKDKLSLPGGRILLGESLSDCVKRIMKDKHQIDCKLERIHSVSLEHVTRNKKVMHSFLLIFVTAKTKDRIELINFEKNKKNIISSDYKLLKEDLDKQLKIKEIFSKA